MLVGLSDPTETQFKARCLTQGPELQLCFKGKPAKNLDLETQGTWEGVPCFRETGSLCFSWGPATPAFAASWML